MKKTYLIPIRICFIALFISSLFSSCVRQVPVANHRRPVHHDAEWVTPSWQVKRTFWGHAWPFATGGAIGASAGLGAFGPLYVIDAKTKDTLSRRSTFIGMTVVGTGLLGVLMNPFKRKKNQLPKRKFDPKNAQQWVSAYGGNWMFISQKGNELLMVPKAKYPAYQAEEKAIAERKEQARLEEEARILAKQEKDYFELIKNGKVKNLEEYAGKFPNGANRKEVEKLVPIYKNYVRALEGNLSDVRAYLGEAGNFFERSRLESKASALEKYEAKAKMRLSALEHYMGIQRKIDLKKCKAILEDPTLENDALAEFWKGYFMFTGMGGFDLDEDQGERLMLRAVNSAMFNASTDYPETKHAMVVYALLFTDKSETIQHGLIITRAMANKNAYTPSLYTLGLIHYVAKDYEAAETSMSKAYEQGVFKSATALGILYSNQSFKKYDIKKSGQWFMKAVEQGDSEGAFKLAGLYYGDAHVQPDAPLAAKWAEKASEMGNVNAKLFLARLYSKDHHGLPAQPKKSIKMFKEASEAGSQDAMFSLALLSYDDQKPEFRDKNQALYLFRKSAENGHAGAMFMLGKIYDEGTITLQSTIKSRYWLARAKRLGVGSGAPQPKLLSPWETMLKFGDFNPTYIVTTNRYGQVISTERDFVGDMLGNIIGAPISDYLDRMLNPQKVINGVELIYTKDDKSVYGGTITSKFNTNIHLKTGQEVSFVTTGTISLGAFAGKSDPDGINGWTQYSLTSQIRHGAVIGRIGEGEWFRIGKEGLINYSPPGVLNLAINDVDYTNNLGYYDIEIIVK